MRDRVPITIDLLSVHDLASDLQTGQSFLPERSSVINTGIALVLGSALLEVRDRSVPRQLGPGCRGGSSRWGWQWWQGGGNGLAVIVNAVDKSRVLFVQRCLSLEN